MGGLLCVASYHLHNGVMDMVHTGVPPALEGRGIAGRLVAAALARPAAAAFLLDMYSLPPDTGWEVELLGDTARAPAPRRRGIDRPPPGTTTAKVPSTSPFRRFP